MRIPKSRVQRWCRIYDNFALASCRWLPVIVILICIPGLLLTSTNSLAARGVTAVMGLGVGSLFLIMGLYALSAGVSLFYQRIATTMSGALFGLSAGLLFGSFISILGIAGAIAILRHSLGL